MAESASSEDTHLNSCPICLERYKSPRTLSCLHTFCQICLSSYITSCLKRKKGPLGFECPVCRTVNSLPSGVNVEKWVCGLQVTKPMDGKMGKDKLCEICNRKNEKISAVSWCFECQEAICEGCVLNHRVTKGLEHHQMKSLDKFKKEQVTHIPTVDVYCQKHKGKKLEIYCHDHKTMCCLTCMTTDHRKCDKVTTIDEAAGEIKQSAEDERVGERIKMLSVRMRECADDCDKNAGELTSQKQEIETTISDEKRKIIGMFETLEKKARSELDTMHKETLHSLQERRVQYEKRAKILEECRASMDYNLKHFTDLQTCIELDRIRRQLVEQEQYMISEADTIHQLYQYKFTISPSIKNMTSTVTTYGDITRCSEKTGSGKIRQPVLVNTFKVDISGFISEGIYLCDQKILLSVYSDGELRVYDITGTKKSVIKLENRTYCFGLTLIKDNLYAQSCYGSSVITFIDIANQKVQKTINVPNLSARRLASSKNNIIVASVTDVKLLNYDGNLSKTLGRSSGEIFGVCATKDDNILYTDRKTGELYCIDMNGKVIFTYSDKLLVHPTDVKTDDDGNIYVVGRLSHNIHMLTPEGKFNRMFLTEKDGIHRPHFLSFNKDFSKFIVCCDMNDMLNFNGGLYIKVFNLV